MNLQWNCLTLDQLSPARLLEIMRLRSEVFVVEQNCVYSDPDQYDDGAHHLYATVDNTVVAYARILKPGTRFEEPSIGRVVTAASHRRSGLGKDLMNHSIAECSRLFNRPAIRISAQCYLEKFYTDLGFEVCSQVYNEDGIPHVQMIWRKPAEG